MEEPTKTARNKYGITILRRCASCEYKIIDKIGRKCAISHLSVDRDSICDQWVMSKAMENAGRGGGKVKSKEYLGFAIDKVAYGEKNERPTVEEIRKEYLKDNTTIYESKRIQQIQED